MIPSNKTHTGWRHQKTIILCLESYQFKLLVHNAAVIMYHQVFQAVVLECGHEESLGRYSLAGVECFELGH
jgi:hypothetical protein